MNKIKEDFDSRIIIVNSAPRTGNIFLEKLMQDYLSKNNISNISVIMSNHNYRMMSINHENVCNIMIVRNPIDVAKSIAHYQYQEIFDGTYSIEHSIKSTEGILDNFYKYFMLSPNNFAIMFDDLKDNPINLLRMILYKVGSEYDRKYSVNIENLRSMDGKSVYDHKSSFPRDLSNNEIYQKISKMIDDSNETESMLNKYRIFLNHIQNGAGTWNILV